MLLDTQNLNARDPGRRTVVSNHHLDEYTVEENFFIDLLAKDVISASEVQDKSAESIIMQSYINKVSNFSNIKEVKSQLAQIVFGSQKKSDMPMAVPAFSDLFSDSEDNIDDTDSLHGDWKSEESVSTAADYTSPAPLSLFKEVAELEETTPLHYCLLEKLGICQRSICLEDGTLRVGYTTANPQLQGEISENSDSEEDSSDILALSRRIRRRGPFRRGRGAGRGRRY